MNKELYLENIVKTEDLFTGLNPENKNIQDKIMDLNKSNILKELLKGFENSLDFLENKNQKSINLYTDKNIYKTFLPKIDYTAKDIEIFSLLIGKYQNLKCFSIDSGKYISDLINNSKETDFIIHTNYLDVFPSYIGDRNNGKNIIVQGNLNERNGFLMKSGKLIINGNVGNFPVSELQGGLIVINGNTGSYLGMMNNGGKIIVNGNTKNNAGNWATKGEICINGNAGDYAASYFQGAKITIIGNAGECIASNMSGGEVHLNGDYGSIAEWIEFGCIYHKGKLIVNNGNIEPGAKIKCINRL